MSNDRHDDKRVSAAYKELAQEQTPEHLDQKILAMAAGATRKPAYSRWLAWSRPVAWAATITLCLAITLELARDPTMDVSMEASSPSSAPAVDENKRDDDSVEQDLADRQDVANEKILPENRDIAKDKNLAKEEISLSIKPADIELRQRVAESLAETAANEKTSLARSASKQSFNEPTPAEAQPAPVVAEPEAEAPDAVIAFEEAIAPSRARTEEAQLTSGSAMQDSFSANDSSCPAEVRAVASDWLDCILALEAEGLEDAAALEREFFIDTFPDFKLP